MKKTLLLVTSFLFTLNVFSQVGIGTTNIQNGVELQIESNSRGLLIPRVALTATNVVAPVGPAPIATGVLVFNTATRPNRSDNFPPMILTNNDEPVNNA